jgi:putative ATP-dependent endonuclease of OLD family
MRLSRVYIINFRCLAELQIELDDVTVFVGANSTGKSSVLHALQWFFEGGPLDLEDVAGHQEAATVSVGATFTSFSDADREALGSYVVGDESTFWRTWSQSEGEKLTGRGRAFPPFEEVRAHETAMPMRKAYTELRAARPDLGLPVASTQRAVVDAMRAWEADHPDELQESRVSATHLFGFTGGSRLNGRFDFVLVPAVSDPEAETRDTRGTLLRQLLDRAMGDQPSLRAGLKALEEDVTSQMQEIVLSESGDRLRELSTTVSDELQRLVPGGKVLIEPREPVFRMPDLGVSLRVEEGGLETDVGRQGHGFQRALVIALIQQLAALRPAPTPAADGAEPDQPGAAEEANVPESPLVPPALFLGLEEPELYQHPQQARHFASTLARLGDSSGDLQVAYATHSEHFVDAARYERLRRFQRVVGASWPRSQVTRATIAGVAARLADVVEPQDVAARIRMSLSRQLAEAVFARAVLVVEGRTDAGFMQGIADRTGGFDADGIAVVFGLGKPQLPIPWSILTELGIPTYVMFDGDAGRASRAADSGKTPDEVEQVRTEGAELNRLLLGTFGGVLNDFPETAAHDKFAVLHDDLETEAGTWSEYTAELARSRAELGDLRGKSEDVYRLAASRATGMPPAIFGEVIERLRNLA